MFEAVGAFKEGKLSKEAFLDMEQNACPTCGSCAGMFTKKLNELFNGSLRLSTTI